MSSATSGSDDRTLAACLAENRIGFTVGRRLSLPFRVEPISILIGKQGSTLAGRDLITDFSPSSREVSFVERPDRIDLYFRHYASLQSELGHWKGTVVVTCCEAGDDLFDLTTHRTIVCTFRDDSPAVRIEEQQKEM